MSKLRALMSRRRLLLLASLLYFAEGLPFGLVTEFAPLYLRAIGESRTSIGFLSTVALGWTLKFLWAPAIERYGNYRRVATVSIFLIGALMAVVGLSNGSSSVFWICITLIALLSTVQDIAIDATTIIITPEGELGPVNAARVTAYRAALIATGGGLAVAGSRWGWQWSFLLAAAVAFVLVPFIGTAALPRSGATTTEPALGALRRWANRPEFALTFAIVLLYRLGDSALQPMAKPFWFDRGFSAADVGTVTTTFGIAFTIVGCMVGGAVVARIGVVRSLFVLGLFQAVSNVVYAGVAGVPASRAIFYGTAIFETFTNGLGTAAFLAFLMSVCDREHPATEYALLTATYGLSRSLAGTASGVITDLLGYQAFFWLTAAAALPGLAAVMMLRAKERRVAAASEGTL